MASKESDDLDDDVVDDPMMETWVSDTLTNEQRRVAQMHSLREQASRDWRDVEKYHEMRELRRQLEDGYLDDDDIDDGPRRRR